MPLIYSTDKFVDMHRLHLMSVVMGQPCSVLCGVLLTSAWPPAFRSLLHRSHLRHNLCQSFPSDDTFSAAHEKTKDGDRRGTGVSANIRIKQHLYIHNGEQQRLCSPSPSCHNVAFNHSSHRERNDVPHCSTLQNND